MASNDPRTVNKTVIRRLVNEVINGGRLDLIDELYAPAVAAAARDWITPFLRSFPDVRMDIVELIAEGDKVAARFTCTATQHGSWLGHPPTGRRFADIDEVTIYTLHEGRITSSWSLEDTHERLRQLGLEEHD